jgi:hypothetical protein
VGDAYDYQSGLDGNKIIDRKLNSVFTEKAVDLARRQAATAAYNGLQAMWELPTTEAVAAANWFKSYASGVEFRRLNLDSVKFPESEDHLVVHNYRCVIERALDYLSKANYYASRQFSVGTHPRPDHQAGVEPGGRRE